MKSEKTSSQLQFLAPSLREMLDPKNPLYRLSETIDWTGIEAELSPLYADFGRPAKPIRLMVGLNLLKHMFNLGDETVIKAWVENPYYQFFTGETVFQWKPPVAPSDMVYFRKRIGTAGLERILAASIQLHGASAKEEEVIIDTTVQEKNITHPTDVKLYSRVIEYCWRIADAEGIELRQRYTRVRKKCLYLQRFRKSKVRFKQAIRAERKLKTIAGRLTRELLKKIPSRRFKQYAPDFDTFIRIVHQKKKDADKVYSVHEPDVQCISKGKEYKKYEFGCKVSLAVTKNSGVCVGAMSFEKNPYDGHTLSAALEQCERLTDQRPKVALVDLGYRGAQKVGDTEILYAGRISKEISGSKRYRLKQKLHRRASIEPRIGHLKARFRMGRNFLKGIFGDMANALLAASAMNLVNWMSRLFASILWMLLDSIQSLRNARSTLGQPTLKFQGTF
jgi:transposase, IS5 family